MFSTLSEATPIIPVFTILTTTTIALPHPCCLLIFPDSSPNNTLFITQMETLVLIELPSKPHLFELCEEKKVSTQPVGSSFLFNPLQTLSKSIFCISMPLSSCYPRLPHQVPSSRSSQLSPAVFQAPHPKAEGLLAFPGVPVSFIHSCGPSCQTIGLQSLLLLIPGAART